MTQPRTTGWFPGRVDPVRPGLYEVVRPSVATGYPKRTFLRWDGCEWKHTKESSNGAFVGSFASMYSEGEKWRGLTKEVSHG